MACGVPVLTSSTSALQEIAGGYAYLVDPMDVEAIAGGIVLLATDEKVRADYAELGKKRALDFSWDKAAERTLEVYAAALGAEAEGESRDPALRRSRSRVRTAVVHDWLNGMRGRRKVLEAILEVVPDPTIFTLFHVPGTVSPEIERFPIRVSPLNRLPFARRHYRHYLPLFPRAVEAFDLSGFDLVVSSSHCVAKGAIAPPGVPHLCYCHTPVRYAWDQFDAYFPPGDPLGGPKRALVRRLKEWDRDTAGPPDAIPRQLLRRRRPDPAPLRPRGRGLPSARRRRFLPRSWRAARGFSSRRRRPRPLQAIRAGDRGRRAPRAASRARRKGAGGGASPGDRRELALTDPDPHGHLGRGAARALPPLRVVRAAGRGGLRDRLRRGDGLRGARRGARPRRRHRHRRRRRDGRPLLRRGIGPLSRPQSAAPTPFPSGTLECGKGRSGSVPSASPGSSGARSRAFFHDPQDAPPGGHLPDLGPRRDPPRAGLRLRPALRPRDRSGPERSPGRVVVLPALPRDRRALAGRVLVLRPLSGRAPSIPHRRGDRRAGRHRPRDAPLDRRGGFLPGILLLAARSSALLRGGRVLRLRGPDRDPSLLRGGVEARHRRPPGARRRRRAARARRRRQAPRAPRGGPARGRARRRRPRQAGRRVQRRARDRHDARGRRDRRRARGSTRSSSLSRSRRTARCSPC